MTTPAPTTNHGWRFRTWRDEPPQYTVYCWHCGAESHELFPPLQGCPGEREPVPVIAEKEAIS